MTTRPLALPEQHAPFDEDAARYLHGELDHAGVARLQNRLQTDALSRERFVQLARIHGNLCELGSRIAQGAVDSAKFLAVVRPVPRPATTAPARRRTWPIWSAVAAAALVLGVALTTLAQVHQRTRPMVPTIVASEGAAQLIRDSTTIPLSLGARLRPGDIIQTTASGSVTIALHGGRFTMRNQARAIINIAETNARQITILHGTVMADMTASESTLCILANQHTFLVNNATTSISIGEDGTLIQVVRGQIDLRQKDGSGCSIPAGRLHLPLQAPPTRPSQGEETI